MSIDVTRLRQALDFATVSYVEQTESTNTDLLQDKDAPAWSVRITTNQTSGKGRLGRQWTAPAGATIAMSVLLAPTSVERVGTIPLAAGLAVTDAIDGTSVKWPNDVLIEGKKVCGILAEVGPVGDSGQFKSGEFKSDEFKSGESSSGKAAELQPAARVVIGIGINVDLTEQQLPVPHATSLKLAGHSTDHTQVAIDVLRAFRTRMLQWQSNDEQLIEDYRAVCSSIGQRVKLETSTGTGPASGGSSVEGVVDTVGVDGRISINGTWYSAGDVTHLRKMDGNYD